MHTHASDTRIYIYIHICINIHQTRGKVIIGMALPAIKMPYLFIFFIHIELDSSIPHLWVLSVRGGMLHPCFSLWHNSKDLYHVPDVARKTSAFLLAEPASWLGPVDLQLQSGTKHYSYNCEQAHACAELMNGWMDGWMDGWIDGWMDGWVDGWKDGWINW